MTPDDVKIAIDEIKKEISDDEMAHVKEDDLYFDILKAIADGTCSDPAECARLALTTKDLDFSRWCG